MQRMCSLPLWARKYVLIVRLMLPLAGAFQALNALAALGLVVATGSPASTAARALGQLTSVPGRLEFVAELEGGGAIVVDYAHTPDALATVLRLLGPVPI